MAYELPITEQDMEKGGGVTRRSLGGNKLVSLLRFALVGFAVSQ